MLYPASTTTMTVKRFKRHITWVISARKECEAYILANENNPTEDPMYLDHVHAIRNDYARHLAAILQVN